MHRPLEQKRVFMGLSLSRKPLRARWPGDRGTCYKTSRRGRYIQPYQDFANCSRRLGVLAPSKNPLQAGLIETFKRIRKQTLRICEPLIVEDFCVQSMDDVSPIKWHLAHTSWFFETFILSE